MNEPENPIADRPEGPPETVPSPPSPEPLAAPDMQNAPNPAAPTPAPPTPAAESAPPSGGEAPRGGPEAKRDSASPEAGEGEPRQKRRRRRRRRKGPESAEGAGGAAEGRAGPERGERRPPARKPRGPRERGRGGRDTTHLATQAVRALADMAQQLLRIEGVDPLAMPRYLDLALRVPLDGGRDVAKAAGTAVDQILGRVREVHEHEKALRPGAVFSYFDNRSDADGCRPREPRAVFDGYSSTGKPQFVDFVTTAIERKDAGIDRLLAGEDVVLTQVTMGRVLRTQQLAEFGGDSPVFKILGQVNAGLFRVLTAAGKCAFSFQLLRGTTLEGRVRLRMHAVGAVDPFQLADPAIMQIVSRFQRRLDTEALRLEGRINNGETDEEEFVLPLLNDLARQLQSRTRHTGRRTQHGLERSEEGQRPTSRAYPDASGAGDERILWDIDQGTIVVLGGKNRVHVFSPDGKHVTSVMMQGAAIERRRQLGRWRLSEPEERGEFRIQVRRIVAREADEANAADEAVTPPAAAPPAAAPPAAAPPAATTPPAVDSPAGEGQSSGSSAPETPETPGPAKVETTDSEAPTPGAPAAKPPEPPAPNEGGS